MNLKEYIVNPAAQNLGRDAIYFVLTFSVITVLHQASRYFIFQPFGEYVNKKRKHPNPLLSNHHGRNASRNAARDLQKFCIASWKCSSFVTLFLFGVMALKNESWVWDSVQYFQGWPNIPMPAGLKLYYFIEFAYYLHAWIVYFYEPRQKDRIEMFLHHFVTLTLIGFSYVRSTFRIGSVVMIIHDIADPFMEAAKFCGFMGWQKSTNVFFALFAVVFILSRCLFYPWRVILPLVLRRHRIRPGNIDVVSFEGETLFLSILQLLHIFWASLILKIAIRTLKGRPPKDIRDADDEPSGTNHSNSEDCRGHPPQRDHERDVNDLHEKQLLVNDDDALIHKKEGVVMDTDLAPTNKHSPMPFGG